MTYDSQIRLILPTGCGMINLRYPASWQQSRNKLSESRIYTDYTDFADYAPAERYVYRKQYVQMAALQRSAMSIENNTFKRLHSSGVLYLTQIVSLTLAQINYVKS